MKRDVRVSRSVVIPASEIRLHFTTSGGPGGQHANRSSTRVELYWNAATSSALGPRQRARVLDGLSSRLDPSGTLRLTAGRRRSQLRNIEDALARLGALVAAALEPTPERTPTRPTAAARRRRLDEKRRRSEVKRARRAPAADD